MKPLLRRCGGFGVVLAGALLTGCQTGPTQPIIVQVLRWDTVVARGAVHGSTADAVMYSRLNIDVEKFGKPLRIQMPDGRVLDTTAPLDTFWPYTMYGHRVKLPEKFRHGHRFFDVVFPGGWQGMIGGYSLEYEDGHMVGLGIGALKPASSNILCPALGVPPRTGIQLLPFTEEELVVLFGPFRDKILVSGFDTPVAAP